MTKLNKRILSALLAAILFLTNFPMVSSASNDFAITYEGKTVSQVEFFEHEKITVSAQGNPSSDYQWQIQIPGTEQWVDIQGQTAQTIKLSKAVVGSLLVNGSAYVRCAAINDGEEIDHTAVLCTTVKKQEPASQTSASAVTRVPAVKPAPVATEPHAEEPEAPVETNPVAPEAPTEQAEIPAEIAAPSEPEAEVSATAPTEESTVEVPAAPTETAASSEPEAEVSVTAPVEEPTVEAPAESVEIPAETAAPSEPEAEFVPVEESAFEATEAPTEPVVEKSEETFIKKVAQLFTPRASADDPDVDSGTEIVSVTIEYYYQDRLGNKGEMVMDPYVARVKKGDPLNVTVACKVFPGYQILLIGSPAGITLNSRNELEVSLSNITENRTYEVHYQEIMVKYYARFFLQNAYNDLYTERTNVLTQDQIDQMVGYAGEQPNESLIHPVIDGFSALFHQPDMIAADGSTVFEVYYDRNYYLINFDLEGGFGTAPVYARYETSFTVATPTRPGYSFAGWELVSGEVPAGAEVDANGLVKKMPTSNMTYRAKWEQQQTSYTVVYWKENAEDNQYTLWGADVKYVQTGSTVNGTDDVPQNIHNNEKAYFTFNPVLSDKNVLVEGDGSTVVNVYYTRNYYTLTFKAPGKCTIPEGHTHTDACYDYICLNGNHTHTTDCLICPKTVHVHSADCCTLGNHVHDADCCSLEEHTQHNASCCTLEVHTQHDASCCTLKVHTHSIACIWSDCPGYEHTHGDGSCTCSNTHTHGDGKCPCTKVIHTHGDGKCSYSCGEHAHSDGGCTCVTPAHQHNSSCYDCGASEHTHTAECRRLICSITVGHTHSGTCKNSSSTNVVKTVTRKYQASLYDIWHQDQADGDAFGLKDGNDKIYNSGQRWEPSKNPFFSQVLVYIANMPGASFTLTVDSGSGKDDYTMNYYLQVLPGEAYTKEYKGYYYVLDNSVKAKYGHITKAEDFFDIWGYKQYEADPSFGTGTQISPSDGIADFYYNRIVDHYLKFANNGILLSDKQVYGIMFGAPLKGYNFKPDYPSNLEPNAYYFDQWYTSAGYYEGTEVNWETLTMPVENLLLHARWLPLTYDVYFYMDYSRLQKGTAFQSVKDTAHGEKMITSGVDLTPTHDKDHTYQFVGWFYLDREGNKTAFNPAEMAVRQELHLYAEWSTMTVKEYAVSYAQGRWDEATKTVIPMEGSEYRALSKDTTGYAFEASTRTFTAKPENQLEELSSAEMSGSIWVPHTNSHSILMQADNDDNVFTFWYVPRANIPYHVRYLDAATGEPVIVNDTPKPDKVVDPNTDAVVTEQFVYVPGYIPDAFYKTLVLSADDSENVIIFYYTKDSGVDEDEDTPDTPSARYLVTHYIQNIGSDDYSVYTTDDLIGVIDSEVKAEVLSIPGFAFDHATPKVKTESGKQYAYGTVTSGQDAAKALKLELYYNRIKYRYTVEYLDADTLQPIPGVPTKETDAIYDFDSEVTETAQLNIPGYDLYGSETQTLKISAIEDLNKITFLYTPKPLTVHYVPICKTPGTTDFGYVLATSEYKDIKGTTAIAQPGFLFKGWYEDEECTILRTNDTFLYPDVTTEGGIYEYTFYALFEPISLTITQKGMLNETDSGIYEVVNSSDQVIATVMLTGNSSVTLEQIPVGTYTVREVGNWTWTYSGTLSEGVTVTASADNEVIFTHSDIAVDWLHSENRR